MRTRRRGWAAVQMGGLVGLLLVAAACCPIPVAREYVVVPGVSFHVKDEAGAPVQGAEVWLVRAIRPESPGRTEIRRVPTDSDGVVRFVEQRAFETTLPLLIHGVHQYFWTWCVQGPEGAVAGWLGTAWPPREGPTGEVEVTVPVDGTRCGERYGDAVVF